MQEAVNDILVRTVVAALVGALVGGGLLMATFTRSADGVSAALERVNARLDETAARLDGIETRLDAIEERRASLGAPAARSLARLDAAVGTAGPRTTPTPAR